MKLVKGGVTLEVTGRSIKAGAIEMSPSEVEKASELLCLGRQMSSLPVLMPINDGVFEVKFNEDKTFDFIRMATRTSAMFILPRVSFDDFDNLIIGLKDAINTHLDRSKLGGEARSHRHTEYLSDEPGIG